MTVGGDPDELDRLAARGTAQAFGLDHAGRWLARAAGWHRATAPDSAIDARGVAGHVARFTSSLVELDHWVHQVATALRAADVASFATRLLALGPRSPLADPAATARTPTRADLEHLADPDLEAIGAIPSLPVQWRDALHRERLRRWIRDVDTRTAAMPDDGLGGGVLDRLAAWFDDIVVDRVSPVADLHVTNAETTSRLHDEVAGVHRLLAAPELTVLSFDVVAGRPTVRVGVGDVGTATHLAVMLPGTGSGVHAPDPSLDDMAALHDHAQRIAPDGVDVAIVLDLYAAPVDLGAAADATASNVAGAAAGAFLADLPTPARVTLVGHSYGALAAARASDAHAVADLVLLGAPGVGVLHRRDLAGADRVWAAQAEGDPITVVADLDEHVQRLPAAWRHGPLAHPLVAHGPDPADPDFGARRLPTAATGPGVAPPPSHGHLEYLRPGTVTLDNVARIVVDRLSS